MLSTKTDVEVTVPTKINADHVRWNLDMNVTVSNTKSTIFSRLYTLFVIVLSVFLIAMVSHQRKQAKTLQIEVHRLNINVLRLISKYDMINRSINRACFHRVTRDYDSIGSTESLIHELSHVSNMFYGNGGRDFNTTSYFDQAIAPIHAQSIDHRENVIKKGVSDILNGVAMPLMRSKNNSAIDLKQERSFLRSARALLTSQVQNGTMTEDERSNNDILNWREPRARRLRRDEGRGKKRQQHRRRPKRSRGRLAPLTATFIGAVPEQHVTGAVYVGPWTKSNKNDSQYSFTKFHLVEDKMSIEVTASGLYMISVQVEISAPKHHL